MKKYLNTLISNLYRLRPLHCNISRSKIYGLAKIETGSSITHSSISGVTYIGDNAKIYGATISGRTFIDRRTSIFGPSISIHSLINEIRIGRFCSIAKNVSLYEYNHKANTPSTYFMNQNVLRGRIHDDVNSKGSIKIGNDVWIGANTTVLSGVSIGDGAIIGANSLVTRDLPPYSISFGQPAKVSSYRFCESGIKELQETQWWMWSDEKIRSHKDFFQKKFHPQGQPT